MFYEGKLKNGVTARDRPTPKGFSWPDRTRPLAFVTTSKDPKKQGEQGGRSKRNDKEREIVKRVVDDVLLAGDLQEGQIGIVTPYSAQVCSFSRKKSSVIHFFFGEIIQLSCCAVQTISRHTLHNELSLNVRLSPSWLHKQFN